jgi:membrane-associated phospholipid phosphatase
MLPSVSTSSGIVQIVILVMLLPALGQLERLREFLWLFVIATLIATVLAWVMPAEGAWAYYRVPGLTDTHYVRDFHALRAGTMPEIAMTNVTGIIQFPSFHAATALMLMYACRGISYLFPVSFLLNLVMIVSTPTVGGHHLMDTLAGLAMVPLAIFILRLWQREPSERLVVAIDSMSTVRD